MSRLRFVFLPVLILSLAGCSTIAPPPEIQKSSTPQISESDMKSHFLALGDSYTIGHGVSERSRWPTQLADLLNEEGYPTEVTVIARTGWTTADLWYGLEKVNPQATYDLVTLLIGVNDQLRGHPIDLYREDFQFMLRKAIQYAGGNADRVIVLSIPDYGYSLAFAAGRDIEPISIAIDAFNAVNREEAEKAGAYYVDITTLSRMALDDFELIADDRLHPSGKMYRMWTEKVYPVALEIIKR
jgi:lysophospholipase L1-like esterase